MANKRRTSKKRYANPCGYDHSFTMSIRATPESVLNACYSYLLERKIPYHRVRIKDRKTVIITFKTNEARLRFTLGFNLKEFEFSIHLLDLDVEHWDISNFRASGSTRSTATWRNGA